jgi:hypothetical protein
VNDELSLIVILFEGVVAEVEFQRDVTPLIAEPAFNGMRSTLVDSSAAVGTDARGAHVRDTASTVSSYVDEKAEVGSRIAIVAPSDEFFGFGRMYQALRAESRVEVGVFRELEAAEAWLGLPPDYRARLREVERG